MLSLASASRVYVHPGRTDMRLGAYGLLARAGELRDGEVHCFCSADRRSVKLLLREGDALWILQKRLSRGRFAWPDGEAVSSAGILQLQWLLDGPQTLAAMSSAAGAPARLGL